MSDDLTAISARGEERSRRALGRVPRIRQHRLNRDLADRRCKVLRSGERTYTYQKAESMHHFHGRPRSVHHLVSQRSGVVLALAIVMALASFTSGGLFGLSEGTATGSHFSPHLADNRSPATHSASSPEADHLLRSPPQSQPDRASAAPSWAAFPPRKATTPYVAGEAPMGITDFGQTSGGTVSYNTSSFEGSAAIHSLVVCASSSPCGSTQLGFQLNTVLGFEDGGNW